MIYRGTSYLIGILLTLTGVSAGADDCHIERQAIVPITFDGPIPTIPASINGHRVNIGIDTGSSSTLLTPETVQRFHLPRDLHRTTLTRGVGGASAAGHVFLDTLGFGGAAEMMKSVAVLSLGGPKREGVAGLIGTDMLSDYDLEFRFPARKLILYRINHCQQVAPPWEGRYMAVPVTISETRRFLVPVELNGHPLTAIFDTGASGMLISRAAAERVGVTEAMLAQDPRHDGSGVGDKTFRSPYHQFERLKIGKEVFHNVPMGTVDNPTPEADMLIGEDYMQTRRFWLSYATKTLFIQPHHAKPTG